MPQSKDRPALWIVDAASNHDTKLSFAALSRRSNQVANFLRAQRPQARRPSAAAARQRRPVVGDHAGGDQARGGGDPRDHAVDAGRAARPARSRPRQGRGGIAGPGRQNSRASAAATCCGSWSALHRPMRAGCPYEQTAGISRRPSGRRARPTPTIRCCSISPPAPRRSRSWCGTASAAIRSARCRRCTGSGLQPGDIHLEYLLAGLGQACLELFLRALECRRHRVRGQSAALRRQGICSRPSPDAA